MPIDHILAALEEERDRLIQAIEALRNSSTGTRGSRRPGRRMSAAAKKRIGQAKKAWWAARKKKEKTA